MSLPPYVTGVDDLIDDTPVEDDPNVAAQTRRALVVPGNILPWIEGAAGEFDVPRDLLAAVIYQHSRFSGLNPSLVFQVAAALADSYDEVSARYSGARARERPDDEELWLDAATAWGTRGGGTSAGRAYRANLREVYGSTRPVEEQRAGKPTGRIVQKAPTGITLGPDARLPAGRYQQARFPGGIGGGAVGGGAGTKPIIPGLTDDEASAVQRVADSLYLKYFGKFPTTQDYIAISRAGYTPATLEEHLRAQPHGGATVGSWDDAKAIADRFAQQQFTRDATDGEVNFLLTNKIRGTEGIAAYYEQLRTRYDTGDPLFAWAADPATWKRTEAEVQSAWQRAGLSGKPEPQLVNEALRGNWTAADIATHVDARPAPGFAQGTTVGEVNRMRRLAEQAKDTLLPGEAVDNAEVARFLQQQASPDDILSYYRAIVPKGSRTGLPVGVEGDYRAMARSVLDRFGVVYEPTPEDLRFFALTQADPQAILAHFADKPEIAKAHPGLAYGMQSEDYKRAVGDLTGAFQGVFPGAQGVGSTLPYGPKSKDSTLLGAALTDRVAPGDFASTLEEFRQATGRAPSPTEFRAQRNRATAPSARGAQFPEETPTPRERTRESRTVRPAV